MISQLTTSLTPVSGLESAMAEAARSMTLLPDVASEVTDMTTILETARTAYINNVIPTLRGDANGDGEINLQDATFVTNIILGTENTTEAADVNLDGVIGISDVMYIVNYVLNGKFPED